MPHYPFEFIQADATTFSLEGFDAVHASPPCQRYSSMTKRWGTEDEHPDLVPVMQEILRASGLPYIIENVPGAPLDDPLLLCGSMFGLRVRRHRLFEVNFEVAQPECDHTSQGRVIGVYGHPGGSSKRDGIVFPQFSEWQEAMGIDWMTVKELTEAIPPRYTHYIGEALMRRLT